jgi:glutaconate CoA-transferase subunit A
MGVPYVPVIGLVGTDLLARRDDMVVAPDPFGGGKQTVVARAMRPDVAVFHAHRADRAGNVSCGYQAEVVMLAEASAHVIVTAEEIVDRLQEKDANGAFLPSILVDTVVHAPLGAHPGGMTGRYPVDREAMTAYAVAARDEETFRAWLEEHVFSVCDHDAYVERFVPEGIRVAASDAAAAASGGRR